MKRFLIIFCALLITIGALAEPRNRYNVLWDDGKAEVANHQAKLRGMKHIPYDEIDKTNWRVYELPPGIAKKSEEWIRAHPHFGDVFEPEGFGQAIPMVEPELGHAVAVSVSDSGMANGVVEGTEWYQTFVGSPTANTVATGAGITIAVFDNGLSPHPFLDARIGESKLFRTSETNGTLGGSHGNPVTGLVFAIAPNAKATNYKIGSSSTASCSWTDVSNAFLYARSQGYEIFNLSYGGGSSLLLQSTLTTCRADGIAIFVSAGNSSTATQFPANHQAVYAISAVSSSGVIAGFSCRGKIELAAPGEGLLTTTSNSSWGHFSGTSGAAPIVSGIAALVLERNPTWTGVQVAEHIRATAAAKLPITDYGSGHARADLAVGATTPPPPPPPPPPSTSGDITAQATWTTTPAAHEGGGEGLAKLTDNNIYTKCLWFVQTSKATATFSANTTITELRVASANDYPVRDPGTIVLEQSTDGTTWTTAQSWSGLTWSARHQNKVLPVSSATGRSFRLTFTSSGVSTPGGIIVQVAEVRLIGTVGTVEPPPPPPPPPPPDDTLLPSTLAAIDTIKADVLTYNDAQKANLSNQLDAILP